MGYRIHSTQGKRQRESHDRPPAGPPAPGAAVRPAARPAVTAVQPTGTSVLRHTALPVGADVPRGPTHLGHLGPPVSYTHLRAHETGRNLVCRLLLEKKNNNQIN